MHCGTGEQTIMWLASVGIAMWDDKERKGYLTLGAPVKVFSDAKEEIEMTGIINNTLENKDHIFVETSEK